MSTPKRTRARKRKSAAPPPSPDAPADGANALAPAADVQAAGGPLQPRSDMQRAMEQPRGSIESVAGSEPESGLTSFSEAPDNADGAGMPPHLRE